MVFQSVIMIINLITLMCVSYAHSVNILYICPVTSTSHHIWNIALTLGLIEKGHNITMLTHNDEKSISQNFHIIEMEDFYNRKHQYFTIEYLTQYNPFSYIKVFYDLSKFVCEHDFKTKGLAILNSYPKDFKFDLIIFDITFGQCLYPLVDRFNKPPVVAVTPFLLPLAVSHAFGNPLQTSYMPLYSTQYTDVMSLKERFINFILVYADVIYRKYIALPAEFELARKYFGTDTRPLDEIEREISILLANTDFNLESPIDVPPNIIPVGGLHIRSSIRLPEDIQQIANRSEGGFIVFSMGSILNSKDISKSKKEIILRAFAKLKRTVFWKIEDNSLKNVPNNVILTKWLPQNDLLGFYDQHEDYFSLDRLKELNAITFIQDSFEFSSFICEYDIKTNGLATLMNYPNDFKFDLIVFDITFGQCLYPLVDRFNKPPVVAVTPFLLQPVLAHVFGYPLQTSYMPYFAMGYSDKMSFKERLINFILIHAEVIYRKYVALPADFELAKTYFGNDIRSFEDIERSMSILLANTDFSLEQPLNLPPNIIPVGGLHSCLTKPLPTDLLKIADNSENGFVVFSMGSILKSKDLEKTIKDAILKSFAKIPLTILWKYEDDTIKDLPKNVIIKKWLPQNDLLAHPNAKLLISHGGALSSQEAMYHGVPVVAIPVFADQIANAARMERKKIGKTVQYEDISEESFYQSVKEVLDDPMYRNNIKTLSKRYRDKLNTPLETAVFWIEYILRHGGGEHLNLASRDMSFFETHSLDIYAILLLSVYAIYSMIRLLLTCFKGLVGLMFDRKPIN